MTATPLDRLQAALSGRYEIERELGRGGMATVYVAHDVRHDRNVALKVLRPELAAVVGAERFLAEIRTTANLQHPHILPLFDSGEADGFLFYVMPHIDGETLAERIERERQLPVDEAVRIAGAVANALHVAHEKGIIHRDVKPANILLSGAEPLVADFGIALAVGAAGGDRLTETGLSVGTPFYMSPEQATGDRYVGPASDVYSLACVLFEMLLGEPPYVGNTAQAVLGKILQGRPVSVTETRRSVPAHVDAAIRKALEKIPGDRFRTARDFAAALGDPAFRHGTPIGAATVGRSRARWRQRVHTGATVALAGLAGWAFLRPTPAAPPVRFAIEVTPVDGAPLPYALAPDGSFLVFTAVSPNGSTTSLHIRRMDALGTTAVPGTERGVFPTVSPDGTEVAFVEQAGRSLKVVPLQGGTVTRTIADSVVCCPTWGADGFVYYSAFDGSVKRVSGDGGDPEIQIAGAGDPSQMGMVRLTASGEALVVTLSSATGSTQVDIVRRSDGRRAVLLENVGWAVPTASGHLVYVDREGRLLAAPLDEEGLRVDAASAVEIAGGLRSASPAFDVSPSGAIAYLEVGSGLADSQPVWVDRTGNVEVVDPAWTFDFTSAAGNRGFSLSPDGARVATSVGDGQGIAASLWIKQLPSGPFQRLTETSTVATRPRWTPTGDAVTYLGGSAQGFVPLALPTDFVTPAPDTIHLADDVVPFEFLMAPGGDWFAARGIGSGTIDLMATRVDGLERHVVETPFAERGIDLSPDGKWLAYESDESGVVQVYVRSFPDLGRRREQVSTSGGQEARWGRTGRELFYIDEAGTMVAVEVELGDDLRIGEATPLFRVPPDLIRPGLGEFYTLYDVAPDDRRFLMMRTGDADAGPDRTVVILNAFGLLDGRSGN